MLARVRELWPEVSVVASHQITREWREYERTSTAVLSAYVQPVAERYLTRLADGVREAGFDGQLYIMQSNCGVDSVEKTKADPDHDGRVGPGERLLGRGRARPADRRAERARARHRRHDREVLADRGRAREGDLRLLDRAQPPLGRATRSWSRSSTSSRSATAAAASPGSTTSGSSTSGPRSAGAVPGPGRLRPRRHRGDDDRREPRARPDQPRLLLRRRDRGRHGRRSGSALDAIAERLGVDRAEAARGVVRIANNNMVNALKLISVNRGYDPRDFTLVAFGGGGGMHAVALAAELGIRKVVIPRAADVFSAWGMLMSDLRRDYFLTRLLDLDAGRTPAGSTSVLRRARRPPRSTSSRRRAIAAEQVTLPPPRQPPLREPGARRSRSRSRRHDRRRRGRDDRARRSTRPTSASTPTGSTRRSSSSAATSSRSPRSASSTPAQLPVTGRTARGRRRRATRTVDYATEGIHEADDLRRRPARARR